MTNETRIIQFKMTNVEIKQLIHNKWVDDFTVTEIVSMDFSVQPDKEVVFQIIVEGQPIV